MQAFIHCEQTINTRGCGWDPLQSHLCDKKEAKEEANGAETKQQQFSTISSSKHRGEHVCHGGHQALQAHKLPQAQTNVSEAGK